MQSMVEKLWFVTFITASIILGWAVGMFTGDLNYVSLAVFGYTAPLAILMIWRSDMSRTAGAIEKFAIVLCGAAVIIGNFFKAYQISVTINDSLLPVAVTSVLLIASAVFVQAVFRDTEGCSDT